MFMIIFLFRLHLEPLSLPLMLHPARLHIRHRQQHTRKSSSHNTFIQEAVWGEWEEEEKLNKCLHKLH